MADETAGRLPFDVQAIRPAEDGKSDKFSWRLYRRMVFETQGTRRNRPPLQVMAFKPINRAELCPGDLYLGYYDNGWMHGVRLAEVLSGMVTMKQSGWAYVPGSLGDTPEDLTDWFWSQYLARGRCLWQGHPEGAGEPGQFAYGEAGHRQCLWCGGKQTLVRREVLSVTYPWRDDTAPVVAAMGGHGHG